MLSILIKIDKHTQHH